ncbi:MAG: TIGR03790 family protein [Pirellulales bacterium]|nr:TIGR03790 family protein [Pirellulales bacterium]
MSPHRWGAFVICASAWFVGSVNEVQGALGAGNVLVLYNQASPDGIAIANYYAQAHPGVRLLGLANVSTHEDISASDYLNTIRPQILPALSSSIDVIVTTKGLPLRIANSATGPGSYTDPFNVTRSISLGAWKPYSSLESELTRIDTIKTVNQMGDNSYTSAVGKPYFAQPSSNPYYQSSSRTSADFHYAGYYNPYSYNGNVYGGMRLTSRLDGYTVEDVKSSIDRAAKAVLLPGIGQIVVDDDSSPTLIDQMPALRDILAAKSQPCVYDNTSSAVKTAPNAVLGYVSHGVHAGLPADYVTGQLQFALAPGAVFESHESFNAFSFHPGGTAMGQGQLAQWLAVGGTVGVGNVQEPGAGVNFEANEDKIFKMLLDGKTWAEAAWSSIRQLSYVNTVVGDPLMTWKKIAPGDVNMDGLANQSDLVIMANYWGAIGQSGGAMWNYGDLNGDGVVNFFDRDLLQASGVDVGSWNPLPTDPIFIPEPSTGILLLLGAAACAAGGLIRFARKR